MSTPSIKVGQGNWGIKATSLLGYANTDKKFVAREFTVGRLLDTATRVNASGNIEGVNANVPRIDYFGGQASLLVEPSAQNLALQSENFGTTWAPLNITVTTGSTAAFTAPDGTTNANLLTSTSSISASSLTQTITVASGTSSISVFAKAGNYGLFRIGNVSSAARAAWFNLDAGVVTGTVNGGSASMQNYGNGWYRCIFTPTTTVSGSDAFIIGISNAPNGTNGVSGSTIYFWGAQLETGSVATSYIPTTTGTVTRNADVISVTGVAGLIGQTEGTIYAEVDIRNLTNADSVRIVSLTTTTNGNNFIEITKRSSTQLRCDARLNSGSTITFLTVSGFVLGVNKIAFAYQDGNYAMAINGAVTTSAQAGMTSSLNTIILGAAGSNIAQFNDRIRAVSIYQTRLPNTTTDGSPSLQSITTL